MVTDFFFKDAAQCDHSVEARTPVCQMSCRAGVARVTKVATAPDKAHKQGQDKSSSQHMENPMVSNSRRLENEVETSSFPCDYRFVLDELKQGSLTASAGASVIRGCVPVVASDATGSCLLQVLIEMCSPADVASIAQNCRGHVVNMTCSLTGQPVLAELVHRLGTQDAAFMAKEIVNDGAAARCALNAFGSELVRRLLEYSASEPFTICLVEQILNCDLVALCCHKFGHAVAMSVLSNGTAGQGGRILKALISNLQRFSRHRFASRVVAEAILQSSPKESYQLAVQLMNAPGSVATLACHNFGVDVVRAVLGVPGAAVRARMYIFKSQVRVKKDKYGSSLLAEMEAGEHGVMSLPGVMGGA